MLIDKNSALIIVDVQNDFCPGGTLAIRNANKIIPFLNQYIEKFRKANLPIYATRDWHPPNHISFKEKGGRWPRHCVQNTEGAKFNPNLKLPKNATIISKGFDPKKEAYSAFSNPELKKSLKERKIKKLFVGGLATEYCVKNTILDGLKKGFEVIFLEDCSKGIDAEKVKRAIEEMIKAGAKKLKFGEL